MAFLCDKLVLSGPPKPKSYTFFVGALGGLIIFLAPFAEITFLNATELTFVFLEAAAYVLGLYIMYSAFERFDVSKVMVTVGATQPIFILVLTWLFWGFNAVSKKEVLAFAMLLAATIIISSGKKTKASRGYLKITILASLIFSLDCVFQKYVFLTQPFLAGFIWMRMAAFLFVLLFLFSRKSRKEILQKHTVFNKKSVVPFLGSQTSGGLANILQSFAISLAPVGVLPIINSLRGIQYVFLFVMALFFSFFFPKILKEEISKAVIIKKIVSLIFIAAGLAILVL